MVKRLAAVVLPMAILLLGLHSAATVQAAGKPAGGVGLQVVPTSKGELVVLDVVPGTPAEVSGLLPGDLLVQVDDFPLAGSVFRQVVTRYLWGEIGSSVTIIYKRPGVAGSVSLTLQRVKLEKNVAPPPGVKMLKPDN